MKWKKLGRIFDLPRCGLSFGTSGFAQSPQALVFRDYVRIYFSTRTTDQAGKYLSHVGYADFDKSFSKIIATSSSPVINFGGLGAFDEHGIFPFNVLRRGNEVWAYTTGWSRRVSVPVDAAIGLAISRNQGLSFERVGEGPVLGPSLDQPCLVGDAFVHLIDDIFHMWYIFGSHWTREQDGVTPARVYKIAHATSLNGIDWTHQNQRVIQDRLGTSECQALPSVVHIDGTYHMFFCYRHATDFRGNSRRGYRIGHACSANLEEWSRDDDNPMLEQSESDWDSEMQCYPHVFAMDGKVYMLYNGNEFGRFGFGLAILEQT